MPKGGGTRDRVTRLLNEAEELLRQRQIDYHKAVALREFLRRRLHLLTSVEAAEQDGASMAVLIQKFAMQALPVPRPPSTYPPGVLEVSSNGVPLDVLPTRLGDYSLELVQRVACMTVGDATQVYRAFLDRAQPLALRAHCHGEKSPGYQELCTVTRQFSAFIGLHAYVAGHAILGSSYQDTDLSTGQVTGFPKGWYADVAALIPVHAGFASLVDAALEVLSNPSSKDALAQLAASGFPLGSRSGAGVGGGGDGLSQWDDLQLLDEASKEVEVVYRFRVQLMTHVVMRMLDMEGMPLHQTTMATAGCWPFPIRTILIFNAYRQRPEVVAALAAAKCGSNGPLAPPSAPIIAMPSSVAAAAPAPAPRPCQGTSTGLNPGIAAQLRHHSQRSLTERTASCSDASALPTTLGNGRSVGSGSNGAAVPGGAVPSAAMSGKMGPPPVAERQSAGLPSRSLTPLSAQQQHQHQQHQQQPQQQHQQQRHQHQHQQHQQQQHQQIQARLCLGASDHSFHRRQVEPMLPVLGPAVGAASGPSRLPQPPGVMRALLLGPQQRQPSATHSDPAPAPQQGALSGLGPDPTLGWQQQQQQQRGQGQPMHAPGTDVGPDGQLLLMGGDQPLLLRGQPPMVDDMGQHGQPLTVDDSSQQLWEVHAQLAPPTGAAARPQRDEMGWGAMGQRAPSWDEVHRCQPRGLAVAGARPALGPQLLLEEQGGCGGATAEGGALRPHQGQGLPLSSVVSQRAQHGGGGGTVTGHRRSDDGLPDLAALLEAPELWGEDPQAARWPRREQ